MSNDPLLKIVSVLAAGRTPGGRLVVTRKFVEGLAAYRRNWTGGMALYIPPGTHHGQSGRRGARSRGVPMRSESNGPRTIRRGSVLTGMHWLSSASTTFIRARFPLFAPEAAFLRST